MDCVKILGVTIETGKRKELLEKCASMLGRGGAISTVNPEILYDSINNVELRAALLDSVCIPDGIGVEAVLKKRGVFTERFPGVELGEALLESREVKLGIIGGKDGVAEIAMQELVMRHGGVIPEFALSGYDINENAFISLLTERKPDIVFVCLGSPKQEIFIKRMRTHAPKTLFLALGGSVDIYSKEKKRAPRAIRVIGCEWLFRMLSEPKRIARLPKIIGFLKNVDKPRRIRGKIGKKLPKNH